MTDLRQHAGMDLDGRVALVVGGTSGIGREAARVLSERGAAVTVVGRNPERGRAVAEALGPRAAFEPADVSLLAEGRRLAEAVRARHGRLDALVHSADVVLSERRNTSEGFELAFATNYLSRVLLNALLFDLLARTAREHGAARIVHVAAAGFPGRLDLARVPPGPEVGALGAHNVGQRANDVYAVELAERLQGTGVFPYVSFPGLFVDTGIRRRNVSGAWRRVVGTFDRLVRPFMRTVEEGAQQTVQLAASGGPTGAVLVKPDGTALDHIGDPRYAPGLRRGLWEASERLTNAPGPPQVDRAGASSDSPASR